MIQSEVLFVPGENWTQGGVVLQVCFVLLNLHYSFAQLISCAVKCKYQLNYVLAFVAVSVTPSLHSDLWEYRKKDFLGFLKRFLR